MSEVGNSQPSFAAVWGRQSARDPNPNTIESIKTNFQYVETDLKKRSNQSALLCKALALCMFALAANAFAQSTSSHSTKQLTIERLYSLPWLIGTKPESPRWSPDSRRLAFLWNDEGTNFYDVWLADRTTGKPIRVTSMPRTASPSDPGSDIAKLEQQVRAETDHGVSDVLWAPDGEHLLFNFHGQLYQVIPGQAPQRLLDSDVAQSNASVAPLGNRVAYLSGGNLWVMTIDGNKPVTKQIYAPGKSEVSVEEFHWSTDGKTIAFIESDASRVPKRGIPDYLGDETTLPRVKRPFPGEPSESRRLGILSADGGTVQWVNLGGDPLDLFFGISWSPDSKTVLVDKSDLYIKDRRLFLVDPETGHAKLLRREVDSKNVTAEWWSDWAPDGRGIFYISDRDNDYHVYYQSIAGGEPRPITAGNFAVFSACVSPAANALFVVTNQGTVEERHLFFVPLKAANPNASRRLLAHIPRCPHPTANTSPTSSQAIAFRPTST
jgi:dipeptidyl-peptidase 4